MRESFEKARDEAVKVNVDSYSYWRGGQKQFFEKGADWAYSYLNEEFEKKIRTYTNQLDQQTKIIAELKGCVEFYSSMDQITFCCDFMWSKSASPLGEKTVSGVQAKETLAKVEEMESKTP